MKAIMLLACLVGSAFGACTDDESSPPRTAAPDAPAFTISPSPTETPCGSIELMDGADVSEREAIETAFPNLPEEGCDRLDVELMHRGGELIWEIHLEAAKPYGCEHTRSIDAETGELAAESSVMCP